MFFTEQEMQKYVDEEWNKRTDKMFEENKRDIIAQLMAVCCTELHTEFKFGKKRLNRFKTGIEGIFRLMEQDGIFGQPFTPENCIESMKNKYGIDFDKWEEKQSE